MAKRKTVAFYNIEQARKSAGFFVSETCQHLGISKATWYRWKVCGYAPEWASKLLKLLGGNLDALGWNGWLIKFLEWNIIIKHTQVFRFLEWPYIKSYKTVIPISWRHCN